MVWEYTMHLALGAVVVGFLVYLWQCIRTQQKSPTALRAVLYRLSRKLGYKLRRKIPEHFKSAIPDSEYQTVGSLVAPDGEFPLCGLFLLGPYPFQDPQFLAAVRCRIPTSERFALEFADPAVPLPGAGQTQYRGQWPAEDGNYHVYAGSSHTLSQLLQSGALSMLEELKNSNGYTPNLELKESCLLLRLPVDPRQPDLDHACERALASAGTIARELDRLFAEPLRAKPRAIIGNS